MEDDALKSTADLAGAIIATAPGATAEVLDLLRGVSGRDHQSSAPPDVKAQRARISRTCRADERLEPVSMRRLMRTLRSHTRDRFGHADQDQAGHGQTDPPVCQAVQVGHHRVLILLVIDAMLTVAQPLLFKRIIDKGVTPGDAKVVTVSAILVALLAIFTAGLRLLSRWYSAHRRGTHHDLRTGSSTVCRPIAFFAGADRGADLPAEQRRHRGATGLHLALSGVLGNLISLIVVLITMFALSWQITVASLILLPLFLLPAGTWVVGCRP